MSVRGADGFADIGAYAAIGDSASFALVALDGAIDWLATPSIATAPLCAALLDPDRGGRIELVPDEPFESGRRYLPDTNVLETTFQTANGAVRITDCLNRDETGPLGWCELARRVEGLSGSVPLRWRVYPRFGFGQRDGVAEIRRGLPVIVGDDHLVGCFSWDLGDPTIGRGAAWGGTRVDQGSSGLLAVVSTLKGPLPLPARDEIERRSEATCAMWRRWVALGQFEDSWRAAVTRSALALRLLIHEPSGAIAAAATTSLPEQPGGSKNWDYRFCWTRDTSFTLDALIRLGYQPELHSAFAWQMKAAGETAPRLPVLYAFDGDVPRDENEVPLAGYRGARPVRAGNAAAGQLQLGTYGDYFETAWLYVESGNTLDAATRCNLAATADLVCEIWREPDSGIWELRGAPRQYTLSKMGCWAALDKALALEESGELHGNVERWRTQRDAIRSMVDHDCWSEEERSYVIYAGSDDLDAGVLRAVPWRFFREQPERLSSTIDALKRRLMAGPLLYRYSGMQEEEGAFLACSFWLVSALAEIGEEREAIALFEELLSLSNDVGLYAEQMDPASRQMLGNVPQALSHLALISAAHRLLNDEPPRACRRPPAKAGLRAARQGRG